MRSLLLGSVLAVASAHAETEFRSGAEQVPLLELFTSEGCSSCPPAERWLSQQLQRPDLWQRVVPIAWHVDYWDQLGWPDRFARPEYSRRQHRYAGARHLTQVYTPGMLYAGKEWRGFFRQQMLPEPSRVLVGKLTVRVEGKHCDIRFAGATASDWQAHIALLGFGLQTSVGRGENQGRILQHDFVVLAHDIATTATRNSDELHWHATVPTSTVAAKRYALAVWVSRADDPLPLQSTGGWLP